MLKAKYIFIITFLLFSGVTFAQKNERDYIRSGNRLFKDSMYVKAEVDYRKAIEQNPRSTEALYNLGNALTQQQKFKEAMEQYDLASKMETNKNKLAHIYHNMGVILQAGKQYAQCIEAYKEALRNNPKDDETRYNLALAQKMLNDQQQNQDNQQDQQNQEQQEKEQEQKEQEQQQNNQDQQQQQQQPQQENEMSKENAQQLLNAAMQDERQTQEKIQQQMQQPQSRKLDKDW